MSQNAVQVPRDLTDFTPKFMFGFTVRQLACIAGAILISVPVGYLTYRYTKNFDIMTYAAMLVITPFIGLATFKKNGMPLEQFINVFLRNRIFGKRIRKYQTSNAYALLGQDLALLDVMEIAEICLEGEYVESIPQKKKTKCRRKSKGSTADC